MDGTLGCGGHAEKILERMKGQGRLIGLDQDPSAIKTATEKLDKFSGQTMILHDNFKNLPEQLEKLNVRQVNGILLDLGVSSPQLDIAERGFSFRLSGPLDMRMDSSQMTTAASIVNQYPERKLEAVIREYGEERFAKRIASRIVEARRAKRIETTSELEQIVFHATPSHYKHGRIHPATRTFQALRIEVNSELEVLKDFLESIPSFLAPKGRLVIISFHSLEDREVKNYFRKWASEKKGAVLTKKPVTASDGEMARNPRSRSAKLRVFENAPENGDRS